MGFSLAAASDSRSSHISRASRCGEKDSMYVALLFPSTGWPVLQRVGSRAQAQHEWLTGLVAPRYVGSSGSGIKSASPASARGFFTTQPPGKPYDTLNTHWIPAVYGGQDTAFLFFGFVEESDDFHWKFNIQDKCSYPLYSLCSLSHTLFSL